MKVFILIAVLFVVYVQAEEDFDINCEEFFDAHKDKIEACEKEEGVSGKQCHDDWKGGKSVQELPQGCSCLVCCMGNKLNLLADGTDPKECQVDKAKAKKLISEMKEETEKEINIKAFANKVYDKCENSTDGKTGCEAGKALATCMEMALAHIKGKKKQ